MTYQVLARKWRPQDFSTLVGQQAVVTALGNALREGRIAQAYLFSGIRGVGKTTAARIFAKALNCEKGPEVGPCNECATCREITAGADLDVLEIDAATYSKVEQVRELAESLRYGPARDRYKVVVLDEVHRLSRQAFDALLKLVEEPPPRLVFIFATTEIDAVPATILSRCQEYHFRRVSSVELAAHLAEICRAESIEATPRALALVARAGEGSVRDAVALLDQLATFGNGRVDEAEAARLLGGLDLALFDRLLGAILDGDAATVSALAREVEENGWDPRQVHAHFLAYCRDALHLALGGEGAALELPGEERDALAARVGAAGYENLLRLLHHLLASEGAVRRSDASALALEIAWLRAAELPKLVRIEALLADGATAVAAAPAPAAPPRPPATRPEPRAASSAPPPRSEAPARAEVEAPARPAPPEPAPEDPPAARQTAHAPAGSIERFREELALLRPALAGHFDDAELRLDGGRLEILYPESAELFGSSLARPANRKVIDAAVLAAFGSDATWNARARRHTEAAPPPEPEVAETEKAMAAAREHPRVQAVLEIFGGDVAEVADEDDAAE
ncbi:MAG: DNA polymerase III subunit gamma/tau [Holophagales bacterium]|nr:DNA polymerase III subunit gamma/tau [Holophagales bacterium]